MSRSMVLFLVSAESRFQIQISHFRASQSIWIVHVHALFSLSLSLSLSLSFSLSLFLSFSLSLLHVCALGGGGFVMHVLISLAFFKLAEKSCVRAFHVLRQAMRFLQQQVCSRIRAKKSLQLVWRLLKMLNI